MEDKKKNINKKTDNKNDKKGKKKRKGGFAKPFIVTLNVFLLIVFGIFA